MTPDSKKRTTKKIPAKKKAADNARENTAKKVAMKPDVNTKEAPAKKVPKKKAVKAKQAPAKRVAKKSSKSPASSIKITSEERWKMIAIAAYHRAENRGFAPGHELQDWAEAEQEVDKLLMSD